MYNNIRLLFSTRPRVSLLYTFKRVEKRSELGASFYFFNCETTKPPSPYLGRVLYKIIITYLVFCLFPRGVLTASSVRLNHGVT